MDVLPKEDEELAFLPPPPPDPVPHLPLATRSVAYRPAAPASPGSLLKVGTQVPPRLTESDSAFK